jgi:hypothetical protein
LLLVANQQVRSYSKGNQETPRTIIMSNEKAERKVYKTPENVRLRNRRWKELHPTYASNYYKKLRDTNPEKLKQYKALWNSKNPKRKQAHQNKWFSKKWKNDPVFRITCNLRSRIKMAIKRGLKHCKSEELLGAEFHIVRNHIASLFKKGMTWKNHGLGRGKWEIDHIKSCESFDLSDPVHQKECFHYSNLQPLWYEEHKRKHEKK